MCLDLSFVLQIALVGDDNDGKEVFILDLEGGLASGWSCDMKLWLTLRICWWNVDTSSNELRDVIEYTSRKPSPVPD